MTRLIVSIVLFVILAVFTALNAQNTSPLNLFGYKLQNVSIVATVVIAMAVGVLYSFALYVTNYLSKRKVKRIKTEKDKNKQMASDLEERQKNLEKAPESDGEQPALPDAGGEDSALLTTDEPEPAPVRRGRRKKKK